LVALIEVTEVDVGFGSFTGSYGFVELSLRHGVFFFLFGDESQQAVSLSWKMRLHPDGESLGLIEPAADKGWSLDVKFAEIAKSMDVSGIELRGALEGYANLDGELERAQRGGMRRL